MKKIKGIQVSLANLYQVPVNDFLASYESLSSSQLLKQPIPTKTLLLKKSGVTRQEFNKDNDFAKEVEYRLNRIRAVYKKHQLIQQLKAQMGLIKKEGNIRHTLYLINKAYAMLPQLEQYKIYSKDLKTQYTKLEDDLGYFKYRENLKRQNEREKQNQCKRIISALNKIKTNLVEYIGVTFYTLAYVSKVNQNLISEFFTNNPDYKAEYELIKLMHKAKHLTLSMDFEIYKICNYLKRTNIRCYRFNTRLCSNVKRSTAIFKRENFSCPEFENKAALYWELVEIYKTHDGSYDLDLSKWLSESPYTTL